MFETLFKKLSFGLKKYVSQDEGAAAVETALTLLPFIMLTLGVMEMGRVLWSINSARYAVEETSRYVSINPNESNQAVQAYAEGVLSRMLVPTDGLTVTTQVISDSGVDFVEVDGDYQVSSIIRIFIPASEGLYTINSTVIKPVIQ